MTLLQGRPNTAAVRRRVLAALGLPAVLAGLFSYLAIRSQGRAHPVVEDRSGQQGVHLRLSEEAKKKAAEPVGRGVLSEEDRQGIVNVVASSGRLTAHPLEGEWAHYTILLVPEELQGCYRKDPGSERRPLTCRANKTHRSTEMANAD